MNTQSQLKMRRDNVFIWIVNKCNSFQRQSFEPVTLVRYVGNEPAIPISLEYYRVRYKLSVILIARF
jgi:hypothetical protein